MEPSGGDPSLDFVGSEEFGESLAPQGDDVDLVAADGAPGPFGPGVTNEHDGVSLDGDACSFRLHVALRSGHPAVFGFEQCASSCKGPLKVLKEGFKISQRASEALLR